MVVPLVAAFAPAAVQRSHQTLVSIGIGTDSALDAPAFQDETVGSELHHIDESVIQGNIRVHQDAIRRSENLFYEKWGHA